jgi:2-methylcitrate dehydratase PrpD
VRAATGSATVAEQFNGAVHKRRPTQIVEAQFALPYLIAAASVHGRVGITEVADIPNAQVLAIAARIEGIGAGHETAESRSACVGRTATVRIRIASRVTRESHKYRAARNEVCGLHAQCGAAATR